MVNNIKTFLIQNFEILQSSNFKPFLFWKLQFAYFGVLLFLTFIFLFQLVSIRERDDEGEEEEEENDDDSVLWITPSSVPHNPSILSLFNQWGFRRLSRQTSSASGGKVVSLSFIASYFFFFVFVR